MRKKRPEKLSRGFIMRHDIAHPRMANMAIMSMINWIGRFWKNIHFLGSIKFLWEILRQRMGCRIVYSVGANTNLKTFVQIAYKGYSTDERSVHV